MHKGESVISFALAVVVVLTFVALQRRWNPASLKEVASSAEDLSSPAQEYAGKYRIWLGTRN
jgi:hypothetical protein